MIHLITIGIDVKKYNIQRAQAEKIKKAYKEITVRLMRDDGLVEEQSCKMIDFLKFMGFEVFEIGKEPEQKGAQNDQGTF